MEEILHQAEQLEKEYDWLGAAELYEKALKLLPEDDFSRKSETCERLGYAFYRAAFQAEGNDEFRQRLRQAIVDYEKAKELYQKLNAPKKKNIVLRCDAINAYMGYWLASKAPEKKRLLDECWRLTKDSLSASKESGAAKEYGKTYNQLSVTALLGYCLEGDYQARKEIIREVAEHGEVGIKLLSPVNEPDELAKAYAKTAFAHSLFAVYFVDLDEKENYLRKVQSYWAKAREASEDSARLEMLCPVPCAQDLLWGYGSREAFTNLEKALEHGRRTRDKFIIGSALDWLAYHTIWAAGSIDDRDEVVKILRSVVQYAEDAKRQYSVISFISPRADNAWIEAIHARINPEYAAETDLGKRHGMLERAIAAGREALERAEASGYLYAIMFVHLTLSATLRTLAEIESSLEEKKKLLEEALQHGNEASRIGEGLEPLSYWDLGVYRGTLAVTKVELADLAGDSETKKSMLQAAILEQENSIKLRLKDLNYQPQKKMPSFSVLGQAQYFAGDSWVRLYRLTFDKEHLRKATEAFRDAVESFQKLNLVSRVAECYWKAAQTYDTLRDHLNAAQNFHLASDNYKSAAEKIPQLKSFYQDHSFYMQAWTEIQKARHHHERQEYGLAKEHFEKAADLHKSLKKWAYLTPNYSAWANVECAEDLSRKEQCERAIEAFGQAGKFFDETKLSLQNELCKIEDLDEKRMANSMIMATDMRHEYCVARIALEEAKILDKKGDHYFSSEKYGEVTKSLERIIQGLESEQDEKEINCLLHLSRAWQKMAQADAQQSPALYLEASELFEKAKEFSPNEKTTLLTLGHSRFCKALEAGAKFTDSREAGLHAAALQHLESAADCYLKAGFDHASEYTRATRLLFDAYIHMDSAAREDDLEKKTKLYMIVEKLLQTSADSYAKAEHPEKKEQVLRLLERAREEKEFAASLVQVLHAPIIASTASFSTPTPTSERAVGLEKLEHAQIQANVICSRKELTVGDSFDLEIELANAGKGTASLVKITGAVPDSFKIIEKPDTCHLELNDLNLKGKRLDPLKTEEFRLILEPRRQGTFNIKPTIFYIDEQGKNKSHEPEPIAVTVVRELGIKGWIKGER